MSARDEVLARIRTALAETAPVEVPRAYRTTGDHPAGHPALVDRLAERLLDYHAAVRRTDPGGLADAITDAVRDGVESPAGRSAVPARIVAPVGVPVQCLPAGLEVLRDPGDDGPLSPADLDTVDGVVTAAAVAIAETGTIVLDGSPDQGRRAITLVPDLHVCVVFAEQVVSGVPEGLGRLEGNRPQTWISGPSATSDIELDRVEGVHGPRNLQVVVVSPGR